MGYDLSSCLFEPVPHLFHIKAFGLQLTVKLDLVFDNNNERHYGGVK